MHGRAAGGRIPSLLHRAVDAPTRPRADGTDRPPVTPDYRAPLDATTRVVADMSTTAIVNADGLFRPTREHSVASRYLFRDQQEASCYRCGLRAAPGSIRLVSAAALDHAEHDARQASRQEGDAALVTSEMVRPAR